MKSGRHQQVFNISAEWDVTYANDNTPEKKLLKAILVCALQDAAQISRAGTIGRVFNFKRRWRAQKTKNRKTELFEWVASDEDHPFSLIWILNEITSAPDRALKGYRKMFVDILTGKTTFVKKKR